MAFAKKKAVAKKAAPKKKAVAKNEAAKRVTSKVNAVVKKKAAPRMKTPAKIAKIIDNAYGVELKIKAANLEVKKLKESYTKLSDQLVETLAKEEIDGAFGKTATAFMESKEHLVVKDRVKFNAFVIKNKALDFLQASIKESSIKEYIEETGKQVPGVGKFISKKLKVKKL